MLHIAGSHWRKENECFLAEAARSIKPHQKHHTTICMGDFNASLGNTRAGEEEIVGAHVFRRQHGAEESATSNRAMLLELCVEKDLLIVNTFFDYPNINKISYRHLATKPGADITSRSFAQIDHVLSSPFLFHKVTACWTDPGAALNTHHYVTLMDLVAEFEKVKGLQRPIRRDLGSLALPVA